jgi:hypothetical protein
MSVNGNLTRTQIPAGAERIVQPLDRYICDSSRACVTCYVTLERWRDGYF